MLAMGRSTLGVQQIHRFFRALNTKRGSDSCHNRGVHSTFFSLRFLEFGSLTPLETQNPFLYCLPVKLSPKRVSSLRRQDLSGHREGANTKTFFFFFFLLHPPADGGRKMKRKKKARAHHTSTYFHTRRVSI